VLRPSGGEIRVRGERVAADPRSLRRAGVAHLSGDRESAGLVPLCLESLDNGVETATRFFEEISAAKKMKRSA